MSLLELTLSGAVFILAVTAFRAAAFRRLPKGTFVALWWAAALRLLVPVKLPARLSVYTLLESLRPGAAAAVPSVPITPVVPAARPAPVLIIPSQTVTPPAPPPFPVWTALWITGAALLGLWFLIRYFRWRRRFRESLPADCPGLETWVRCRRRIGLRTTDQISAPLTYGLIHPVILLPKTLDLADEEAVTCVLAHELAHIRRLDGLFKLALAAALCVHWFNPAVWLFYVLANRDMELRCDEAAVLALGADSRERYALALIRLAEARNECVPLCGFSQKNGMEERIKAIMSIQKKSLAVCTLALVFVLGITTAFATSAKPAGADPDDGGAYAPAEAAAQWDEVLAPYVPFGLTYTFDDPDHDGNGLSMAWEGREVRGIYNQQTGEWITERAGNGTYGPDAVELFAVYEDGKLAGLRPATEEEQAKFTKDRKAAMDAAAVEQLLESLRYDGGAIYFTIPEGEGLWNIWIDGRLETEDGGAKPVRYLDKESEKGDWAPRMTYSFAVEDAAYEALAITAAYGEGSGAFDLTRLLPKDSAPLDLPDLPEGKAEIPEDGSLVWPVDGGEVVQNQGTRTAPGGKEETVHNGVDIGGLEQGTPVYAAGNGTVKEAGFNAQDGNYIRLDLGRGQEVFYAHCASLLVKEGDKVIPGQTIATVGSTGMSTGPHLHFEFLVNGVAMDPLSFGRSGYQPDSLFDAFSASQGNGADGSYAGNPIIAIMDGTILDAGMREKGDRPGLYVVILYEDGYSMEFGGCQSVLVKTGDSVKAGDVIAYTGENAISRGPTAPQDRESIRQMVEKELVNGDYPRNSRGETYGIALAAELVGCEPDLIAAIGTNEEEGYFVREDDPSVRLEGDEYWACQNWLEENRVRGYYIPLYDQEHNVIGDFEISAVAVKGGVTKTFEQMQEAEAQGWPNKKGSAPEDREPIFKTMEEAQEALRNGWVGDNYVGYYEN